MGRPKKDASAQSATKKTATKPAAKKVSKKRDTETLATLAEIESKLLKKAKNNGDTLDQSDIYDALNNYELEDDVIDDLIEYFAKQKIEVISDDGIRIGRLYDVLQTGANDVYVVEKDDGGEVLIPVTRDFVTDVDLEAGKITVHLLPGLPGL